MASNFLKINTMGSEVITGYRCKPKVLDPNKPIMFYKHIVHVCIGKRCSSAGSSNKADQLRELVKEMHLDRGAERIKISKSLCYGACRYKQVATIFANTQADAEPSHNGVWLKATHEYDEQKWRRLFLALKENRPLDAFEQIEMKIF